MYELVKYLKEELNKNDNAHVIIDDNFLRYRLSIEEINYNYELLLSFNMICNLQKLHHNQKEYILMDIKNHIRRMIKDSLIEYIEGVEI